MTKCPATSTRARRLNDASSMGSMLVGDPALHQMVRPIVQHVAALTEGPQIFQPIVGGIAVQVRRCVHDARHPEPSCLHKVRPTGSTSAAMPPGRRLFVEPAPVRQAAEEGKMGSATALASSSGAVEADVVAQFAPMRGIEWSQLRADWMAMSPPSSQASATWRQPRRSSDRPKRRPASLPRVSRRTVTTVTHARSGLNWMRV